MKWWGYIIIFLFCQIAGGLANIPLSTVWPAYPAFNMMIALAFSHVLAICLVLFFKPARVSVPSDKTRLTLLALLMAPPIIVLANLLSEVLPELPNIHDESLLSQIMNHPFGILCITVIAPVSEELLFRAGVLGGLLNRGAARSTATFSSSRPMHAILLSAAIFSLAHFNPFQMPVAFILGIFLGWAYWRTGSLLAPCLIHILNNGLAAGLALTFDDFEVTLSQALGGTMGVFITVCISVVWLGACLRTVTLK